MLVLCMCPCTPGALPAPAHQRPSAGGNKGRPFKFACSLCDFRARHKHHLHKHVRTHTGERPYQCSFCEYVCSQEANLRRHERTHTGERPYQCSFCDYACSQEDNLRRHESTHTGERPYQCSLCAYRGTRKAHLRRHGQLQGEYRKRQICDKGGGAVPR